MRYQLLGVRSGTCAHLLSTLLESWRRMLRGAAVAGGVTFVATEIITLALVHQFPPSLPSNAVALGLGIALAYSAAATIFIQELFRGAVRAITMLQGEAEAVVDAAVTAFPTGVPGVRATPQPMRLSQPVAVQRMASQLLLPYTEERLFVQPLPVDSPALGAPSIPSVPSTPVPSIPAIPSMPSIPDAPAATWAGTSERDAYPRDAYLRDAYPFLEDEPTRPVGVGSKGLDDGATVMVPDDSMYVPRLAPRSPPSRTQPSQARPSSPVARMAPFAPPTAEDDGAHPLPGGIVAAAVSRMPPLAEASPSPGRYAPWSAVPPLADPTAKTELSTMAAREAALAFQPVRRPGWWPRRRVRPLPASNR